MGYSIVFKNYEHEIPVKVINSIGSENITSVDDMIKVMPRPVLEVIFDYKKIDFQEILECYLNDERLSELTIYYCADESITQEKQEMFVHFDYMIRCGLLTRQDEENADEIIVVMKLAQLTEVDKSLRTMSQIVAKNHNYLSLEEYKEVKIEESKANLEKYLREHPLRSNCHNGEYKYYNATKDKRDLFISAMFTYQIKKQTGIPAVLKWNATGEECIEWTEAEGVQFAIDMEAYITPLVSAQQAFELAINSATSKQELDNLNLNYSTVGE